MPKHRLQRPSRHAPDRLFELAGDVRRYPEFLPWVRSMRVWNERTFAPTVDDLDAEAGIGFAFFTGSFATRVRRDAANKVISTSLISGPFKKLENRWTFAPAESGEGSLITFKIDFEFRSRLMQMLLDANFEKVVGKLVAAFEARADALYGSPPSA